MIFKNCIIITSKLWSLGHPYLKQVMLIGEIDGHEKHDFLVIFCPRTVLNSMTFFKSSSCNILFNLQICWNKGASNWSKGEKS